MAKTSTVMLTKLPQELFILIVSFLPFIDAVRLCSLSRRWTNLWIYSRIIELDESFFTNKENSLLLLGVGQNSWTWLMRRKFIEFVDRMMPRFIAFQLSKFSLRVCYQRGYHYNMEEWITHAVKRNVEELILDFSEEDSLQTLPTFYGPRFTLSKFFYNYGRSMRGLSLKSCHLGPYNFQSFISLTTMSLTRIETSNEVVMNLLTNCPLLEVLSLVECTKLLKLEISSPGLRLIRLIVRNCTPLSHGFELCAPRLRYFEYFGDIVRFEMKNLKDLVEVVLDYGLGNFYHYHSVELNGLLRGFSRAKVLLLCSYIFKYYLYYKPPLPLVNLEHMTLKTGVKGYEFPVIFCLLGSSPNIKSLSILTGFIRSFDEFVYSHFPPVPNGLWTPPGLPFVHLKTVKMEGFTGNECEMNLLKFLLRNARVLETMIIIPRQYSSIGSSGGASSSISLAIKELLNVESASENVEITS